LAFLGLGLATNAQAQLSPVGYTAAINTPTADTLLWGVASMAWTNNNPERVARFPRQGLFGSFNLGFGLMPGLEVAGRLASDGDTDCNMFVAGCASSMRDVSLSAKYSLPLNLPLRARVAVGFSDYGGAATHFRQAYGVVTLPWRDVQASLGYSKPGRDSGRPLMDGPFASLTWQASDDWRLALEHDSRDVRGGLWYAHALSARWQAQMGLSSRFKGRDARRNTQLTLGLQYSLQDHAAPVAYASPRERDQAYWASVHDERPKAPAVQHAGQAPSTEQALALQQALRDAGFQAVRVGQAPGTWVIEAEAQAWRQEPLIAVGVALGTWLKQQPTPHDRVHLRTTYMGQTVFTASSSASCALALGGDTPAECPGGEHTIWAGPQAALPQPETTWLTPEPSALRSLRAEAELGPALDYTVGTEVGLFDYTLGLDGGWQVSSSWLPGVFWQGHATTPLARSDDFERDAYFGARDIRKQVQINLLSALAQPLTRVWLQANWGKISPRYQGGQVDVRWLSRDARFGLGASMARYEHVMARDFVYRPQLLNASFSPVPGRWTLRAIGGQFFMGDRGFKLSSEHDFGRYTVAMYYRRSGNTALSPPKRAFAGVQISLPIGPTQAWRAGPLSVRGRDRMAVGLESKVGEDDNIITGGYGLMPVPRHGLNDVLGHASTALQPSARSARQTVLAGMAQAR
jgi:hypothetical protein